MPQRSKAVDDFDDAAQPRCPDCGVLTRDVPDGWVCPSCGHKSYAVPLTGPMPDFDGHSILGG
jgi:rubredoxin